MQEFVGEDGPDFKLRQALEGQGKVIVEKCSAAIAHKEADYEERGIDDDEPSDGAPATRSGDATTGAFFSHVVTAVNAHSLGEGRV